MKNQAIVISILVLVLITFPAGNTTAYRYCGFHNQGFNMTAYHWNSEFWVDMIGTERAKWDAVHDVLSIGRRRQSTVPVGRDDRSVISWISESDLNRFYGLSWSGTVGWTISWNDGSCGRLIEADMFFNPGIGLFTAQTQVPYSLGFQEIALHELGHVLTLDHEDGSLSVMTAGAAVSNVLHHNDKVGWLRSADFRFSVTDRRDMGVFPLRNDGANKVYARTTPATVRLNNNITINDISVENLSSGLSFSSPAFDIILERVGGTARIRIGGFSWGSFGAFSGWSGNISARIPSTVSPGNYRVTIVFTGSDSDASNNRAVIGTVNVIS